MYLQLALSHLTNEVTFNFVKVDCHEVILYLLYKQFLNSRSVKKQKIRFIKCSAKSSSGANWPCDWKFFLVLPGFSIYKTNNNFI